MNDKDLILNLKSLITAIENSNRPVDFTFSISSILQDITPHDSSCKKYNKIGNTWNISVEILE